MDEPDLWSMWRMELVDSLPPDLREAINSGLLRPDTWDFAISMSRQGMTLGVIIHHLGTGDVVERRPRSKTLP